MDELQRGSRRVLSMLPRDPKKRNPPRKSKSATPTKKSPSTPTPTPVPVPTGCAPSRYGRPNETLRQTGTCLTPTEVEKVADAVGVRATTTKNHRRGRFDAADLVKRVHAALGTKEGEEARWTEADVVKRDRALSSELESAFRPTHPDSWLKDPRFWLSNLDIDAVMRQYEASVPDFRFVGVFPRDFSAPDDVSTGRCVSEPMCQLHVATELARGKRQIGFVINLDDHTERGSHWTACYIGLDPVHRPHRFGLFYYDSIGRGPPAEIKALAERIKSEVHAVGLGKNEAVEFVVRHNRVRKQFLGSECGIYSMFFLVACVHMDVTFDQLCRDVMKRDNSMHRLRNVFFRPPLKQRKQL